MFYYIDTEFHEYHRKVITDSFGLTHVLIPTVDLISIGIVSDDDREYYAICSDCCLKDAWENWWLKENVLRSIFDHYRGYYWRDDYLPFGLDKFCLKTMQILFKTFGFSRTEIAQQLTQFVYPQSYYEEAGIISDLNFCSAMTHADIQTHENIQSKFTKEIANKFSWPVFYGYYADYDWVVFAQLFGNMISLPTGFPMYCKDLKQYLDDLNIFNVTEHPDYPKQEIKHNALEDARWNKELHRFIITR